MLFNSRQFLLFFPLVTLVYFLLPKRRRWIWLLIASYYFYMCWNARYALLMLLSTAVTYASGRLMETAGDNVPRKKLWVGLSFGMNLAILAFFKYAGFLLDNAASLAGALGLAFTRPKIDVLLPVGISFYTFQALSYTADVYRGLKAEHNFFRYALYVSFFPQLVAGPIERSENLLPQMREVHSFDWDRVRNGLYLMVWGYFEKMVIADRAAVFVDAVYADYGAFSGLQIAAATVLFAVQIYCDFGGYSHIAIGAAEVLGFRLMQNFRQPYFAASVKEFWRRWHISLSTWFRDYLYIPLGGSRRGRGRTCLNTMITFLLSGLWHGASWHYVVWGGLNGAFQVAESLGRSPSAPPSRGRKLCRILLTDLLIVLVWVFFRAESLTGAFAMLAWAVSPVNSAPLIRGVGMTVAQMGALALSVCLLLAVDVFHEKGFHFRPWLAASYPRRVLGAAVCLGGILTVLLLGVYGVGYDAGAFIYFQF